MLREYGELAPRYDRRWAFYIEATVGETLRRLPPLRSGRRLLDVGCGSGALLEALARSRPGATPDGAVLTGADLSPGMLAMADRRLGGAAHLVCAPAESLPFAGGTFDQVVSTNAFHFFRRPGEVLEEMFRVLRPGGCLAVTDWCDDYLTCKLCDLWLRLSDAAHHRSYGRNACHALLEEAGFRDVRVERYRISWLWGLMTALARKPGSDGTPQP